MTKNYQITIQGGMLVKKAEITIRVETSTFDTEGGLAYYLASTADNMVESLDPTAYTLEIVELA